MYMNHVKLPNVDVMLFLLKKKAVYRFSLMWTFHVLLKKVLRRDMEEKLDARVPKNAEESLEGWGVEAPGLAPFPAEGRPGASRAFAPLLVLLDFNPGRH